MFDKWGGFIVVEHQPYNKIGITESGDPCFDFSWVKNIQDANIIITKGLNDRMIKELIKNKDKIILHLTCTGNGGTDIEPNVLTPEKLKERLLILLKKGFNSNQIVLRIDPIILNKKYYNNSFIPVVLFKNIIKRLRFSFLNMFSSGNFSGVIVCLVKSTRNIFPLYPPFIILPYPHLFILQGMLLYIPYYHIMTCCHLVLLKLTITTLIPPFLNLKLRP